MACIGAAGVGSSFIGAVLDPTNTENGVWADTAYRSRARVEVKLKLTRFRGHPEA